MFVLCFFLELLYTLARCTESSDCPKCLTGSWRISCILTFAQSSGIFNIYSKVFLLIAPVVSSKHWQLSENDNEPLILRVGGIGSEPGIDLKDRNGPVYPSWSFFVSSSMWNDDNDVFSWQLFSRTFSFWVSSWKMKLQSWASFFQSSQQLTNFVAQNCPQPGHRRSAGWNLGNCRNCCPEIGTAAIQYNEALRESQSRTQVAERQFKWLKR